MRTAKPCVPAWCRGYRRPAGLRPSDHVGILYAPDRNTDIELASKVGGQYPAALLISILGWAAALGLWLWRRSLKAKGQSTAAD